MLEGVMTGYPGSGTVAASLGTAAVGFVHVFFLIEFVVFPRIFPLLTAEILTL
jgi:hypothetical protein